VNHSDHQPQAIAAAPSAAPAVKPMAFTGTHSRAECAGIGLLQRVGVIVCQRYKGAPLMMWNRKPHTRRRGIFSSGAPARPVPMGSRLYVSLTFEGPSWISPKSTLSTERLFRISSPAGRISTATRQARLPGSTSAARSGEWQTTILPVEGRWHILIGANRI
jgi:hypothetical protein